MYTFNVMGIYSTNGSPDILNSVKLLLSKYRGIIRILVSGYIEVQGYDGCVLGNIYLHLVITHLKYTRTAAYFLVYNAKCLT